MCSLRGWAWSGVGRGGLGQTPPRLLYPDGRPGFDLKFYAVNKRGDFGAASFFPGKFACHDGREAALRDAAAMFERPA